MQYFSPEAYSHVIPSKAAGLAEEVVGPPGFLPCMTLRKAPLGVQEFPSSNTFTSS